MIRFIDIRGQGTGSNFSFWDTVKDEFIGKPNEYAWTDWVDFVGSDVVSEKDLERYKVLCPEWAFNGTL